MPAYAAPTRDQLFILHDVLGLATSGLPGADALDRDFTAAILEEAGRIASDVLAPLNATGDRQGCTLENGVVRTPDGFRDAFDVMRQGGWTAIDCDPDFGGQGLPHVLHTAVQECFVSANMAFNMYQGLTHGAYSAIHHHGTPEQKAFWLPKLVDCTWTGTMNLTEPHCGTDLGLLRTRAEPQPDGSYRITGTKIFISAGDHDLAGNIVHLVLARIPGGPEGVKGISLFIVPKVLPDADGRPGARNGVQAVRIERKMGIHGNATCEMRYDGATGWLLGEPHKGMRAMFTMMNEARLGVGLQGYAQAEAAYQAAVAWSRDRLQGRSATGARNPAAAADPLIVHPDVRRALMDMRGMVEGARALTYWGALLIDQSRNGADPQAEALVSLLTPVIKGFLTDMGFQMTVQAQQVFGGHGYVEDTGIAQFVRDARIAMIYEGANGIQALDLVARKLPQDGARAFRGLMAEIGGFLKDTPDMPGLTAPLRTALGDLEAAALWLMEHGAQDPEGALAGSTDFLHLMGHVCLGYMWARMAAAAGKAPVDPAFAAAKSATARYYMARQLPATGLHLTRLRSGAVPVMALPEAAF